jgi:formamidopyrimidine-DNA glycosylase
MPELPEVETVRRGLQPFVEGRVIATVEQRRANLRFPFPDHLAQRLTGRRVLSLERRAKYLLWHLSSGESLISHLGMSGSFRVESHEKTELPGAFHHPRLIDTKHDHLVLVLDDEAGSIARITYHDPRRFGFLVATATADLAAHPLIRDIGMEPLGNALDGDSLASLFAGRKAPLKLALLDQKLICGIGNIYASEALWLARLAPERAAGSLVAANGRARPEAAALASAIRDVLVRAIEAGGSTLRDHRQADGTLGYFQHSFSVYGRNGAPCPRATCCGVIERSVQSGRSTFQCRSCQLA